jgi:hypothetical protein
MDGSLKPYVVGGIGRARIDREITFQGIQARERETGGA